MWFFNMLIFRYLITTSSVHLPSLRAKRSNLIRSGDINLSRNGNRIERSSTYPPQTAAAAWLFSIPFHSRLHPRSQAIITSPHHLFVLKSLSLLVFMSKTFGMWQNIFSMRTIFIKKSKFFRCCFGECQHLQ